MIRSKTKNNQIPVTPCIVEFYEFISVHKHVKAGSPRISCKGIKHHENPENTVLCLLQKPGKYFSTNVLHHQCCKSIDNSPQEYSLS